MAETSNFIIQYLADMKSIKNQLRDLDRINKSTADKFGSQFSRATQIVSQQVDRINNKVVKIDGKPTVQSFAQISTVFRDAEGKLKTFTENGRLTNEGFKVLNSTIKNGSNVTRSFADNIKTLGQRALVTIPIWFALRTAIFGTVRGIRDGIGDIVAFDRALQKLKRNVSATSQSLDSDFENLKNRIVEFSLESGVSVQKITNAIQKFATVGFDTETALSGGLDATRLAILLFGDAEETADAFSRAMRILVDTSAPVAEQQKQIAEGLALTSQLWQTNQFDINEVNQALEKFAPVAKTTNLSIKETLTLLATLGTSAVGGARGGTLLRTSLQKLLENLNEVSSALGVKVNPELDTTFTTLLKVIDASASLGDNFQGVVARSKVLSEVFGGVRGSLPIQALTALNDVLKENTKLLPDVGKFNKEYENQLQTVNRLVEINKNLRKELGRTFAEGLTNADNFEKTLERINELLESQIENSKTLGTILGIGFGSLVNTVPGEIFIRFQENRENINEQKSAIFDRIRTAFKGQLNTVELGDLIAEIQEFNIKFPKTKIDGQTLGVLTKSYAEAVSKGLENEKISIKPNINLEKPNITGQNETIKELQKIKLEFEQQQDISEAIIQNELEKLKLQGASASELLKAESALKNQFGIIEDELDILKRQLDTERAINEERKLRNQLSSETVKLFKIAQESGVNVAKQIGDVLSGNVDFTSFVRRGGEALEVFKQQFADVFEQQQATAFFRGQTLQGLNSLRGGSGISISESQIRSGIPTFSASAQVARNRAVSSVPQIRNEIFSKIQVSADISGISINEALNKISTEFAKELLNPSSPIYKAFEERLNNF